MGNGLFCDFIAFSKVSSCAFCVATVDCRLWASCWELERRFCEGKEGREGGREEGGKKSICQVKEGKMKRNKKSGERGTIIVMMN